MIKRESHIGKGTRHFNFSSLFKLLIAQVKKYKNKQ